MRGQDSHETITVRPFSGHRHRRGKASPQGVPGRSTGPGKDTAGAGHPIKHDRGWGRRSMRYSPSDKTEIIRLVEQSTLPARRTLEKLDIPRSSFYRWYDRYRRGGPEALADRPSRPDRVWNRIPEAIRSQIVDLALDQPELSPRELAVRFMDQEKYFVSEASVYRLLKAHDLITSPAGLHRDQSGRGVQGQNHGRQRAMDDRLPLSQGYGLRLV